LAKRQRDESRARVAELEAALEEREAEMHLRIRAVYDKTVADLWRAKVAELEEKAKITSSGLNVELTAARKVVKLMRRTVAERDLCSWSAEAKALAEYDAVVKT
jgi:hypothetical protein